MKTIIPDIPIMHLTNKYLFEKRSNSVRYRQPLNLKRNERNETLLQNLNTILEKHLLYQSLTLLERLCFIYYAFSWCSNFSGTPSSSSIVLTLNGLLQIGQYTFRSITGLIFLLRHVLFRFPMKIWIIYARLLLLIRLKTEWS